MRKLGLVAASAAGVMLLAAGVAVAADQTGSNAADRAAAPTPASMAVQQAHLAAELADYGRKAANPMALVLAAELTATTAGPVVERTKTTRREGAEGGGSKTAKPAVSVSSLLGEARAMAGPDTSLQPAIQRIEALESRGRVEGPGRTRTQVVAHGTDVFNLRFRGGEPAIIGVDGDGDTDLDLYVYDQNGNRICSDTDYTDTLICRWTPAWTGAYRVEIRNLGNVYNEYVLLTN